MPSISTALLLLSGFFLVMNPQDKPARQPAAKAPAKPAPPPASAEKKADTAAAAPQQDRDAALDVPTLIDQGKGLYRSVRFKEALSKFEAALRKEPENDEALGLAAVTAFRLDNQALSREYFLRRAELAGQKDTVKSYCFYRIALTYWREAHDMIAKYGSIAGDRVIYRLQETTASDAASKLESGQEFAERSLAIARDHLEAHNIRNLLYAESALIAPDERAAAELRNKSMESLKRSLDLADLSSMAKRGDSADFSQPTVRISEIPRTKEEESSIYDPVAGLLEGGRAIRRVEAVFPRTRSQATPSPQAEQKSPEEVKVEVLIATTGDVVFAHVIDGKPELTGAALIAARSWKFEPPRLDGRPVQISSVITFVNRQARAK